MITKKMFCEHIVEEFAKNNGLTFDQVNHSQLPKSSSLCVAMEFLKIIPSTERSALDYAASRNGTHIMHVSSDGEVNVLTTRELLSLLPTELKCETNVKEKSIAEYNAVRLGLKVHNKIGGLSE